MKLVNEKQVIDTIDLLGWKDISTKKQQKNGTIIYRLPIKMYGEYIEVGSFQSGYVRRMNGGYTPYQLNKCEPCVEYYKDYEHRGDGTSKWTGKYNRYVGKRRIIIRGEVARLRYLVLYCLKNYYINQANQVEETKKYTQKLINELQDIKRNDSASKYTWSGGQITDNETGDIYVHNQHAYWNKWKEDKPSSVEIIIDGHRYKIK